MKGQPMGNEALIQIIDNALAKSKKALQTEQDPAIMMDLIEIGAALECVKEYLEFEIANP
jgi:hypothetical protein